MRPLYVLLLVSTLLSAAIEAQNYKWNYFNKLNYPRRNYPAQNHCAVFDDCKVLVAGGYVGGSSSTFGQPTKKCEIINVCCSNVTLTGDMVIPRAEHILLTTPDSNVIAISGITQVTNENNFTGTHTTTVELYTRATGTWSTIGNINTARRQGQGVFISSHEVFIIGGRIEDLSTLGSAEIFDLNTGTSTNVANAPMPINMHVVGIASNGDVIIAAGRNGGTDATRTPNIYRYNRSTNTYTQVGTLPSAVRSLALRKVFDGRLLMSGGLINESSPQISSYIEIENSGSYSQLGSSLQPRWGHGIGQINNDSCIVFGGGGTTLLNTRAECDWINVSTNQVSAGPSLPKGLASFNYASVPLSKNSSGQVLASAVLVIGGVSGASEMQKETPRDTIFILRRCSVPDSIKSQTVTSECATVRLYIDSLYRCLTPTLIRWSFGDSTYTQTSPWSTTHTYPRKGTYVVKATLVYANCADSVVLQQNVTITTGANIVSSPRTIVKCAKDSVVQLHASGGVRYLWSPGSGLSDSTSANPIARPTKDTKYIVYGWSADSCRGVDSVFVRVSSGRANAGPDKSMCGQGDSVVLVALADTKIRSVKWTPKTGLDCDTCLVTNAKPTVTTNYVVTLVDTNGCVLYDTVKVSIRAGSAARIAGGPIMNICSSSDSALLSLTTKGGVRSVRWTPNVGLSCDSCFSTKALPKTAVTYKVLITDSSGCITVDSIQVTVNKTSNQIQSGAPQYICFKGDSAVLSVSGKVKGILWSPSTEVSCSTCTSTRVKPPTTRFFRYNAVDSAGCYFSDSIKVTVLPKSTVDIAPDTSVCGSTAILLNVYGQYQNINWTPTGGLSCTNCPTVLVNPTPGKTITYYVTSHNGNSADCDNRDSITVRFARGIDGQLKDQVICPGDSLSVTLRPFGGHILWNSSPDISCDTCRSITIKPTKNGKYIVTGDSLGCISRDTFLVTLAPTTLSVPKTLSACAGQRVMMGATTNSTIVTWTPPDDLSCTDCPNPQITASVSRTYYVTAGRGSCQVRDSVVLTVKPAPSFSAFPLDTTICGHDPVIVHLTVQPSGTTVSWDPNSDLQCYNCADNVIRPTTDDAQYTVHLRSPSGCDTSLVVRIHRVSLPKPNIVASRRKVCQGDTLSLQLSPVSGATYSWSSNKGSAAHIGCDSCSTTVVQPQDSTRYYVRIRLNGCETLDSIDIAVEARAQVQLSADTTVCAGTLVQMHVTGGDVVEWGTHPDISCTSCRDQVVTPQHSTTYTLRVGMGVSPDCWRDTSITITTIPCNVKVDIQSTGVAPFLACDSARSLVSILNDGDLTLRIDSVIVAPSSSASVSKADLQALQAQLPTTLAAHGGTIAFTLNLIPLQSGAASADILVYCSDSVRIVHLAFTSYNRIVDLSLPPTYSLRSDTTIHLPVTARSVAWSELRLRDSIVVTVHIDSSALLYQDVAKGAALNADWRVSFDTLASSSANQVFTLRGSSVLSSDGEWFVPEYKTLLPVHSPVNAQLSARFPSLRIPCADQNNSGSVMTFSACAFSLRHVTTTAASFGLINVHPNPVRSGSVHLRYGIAVEAAANLVVYNTSGQLVAVVSSGLHSPGEYDVDLSTRGLSNGEYLIRLEVFGQVYSTPLVIAN